MYKTFSYFCEHANEVRFPCTCPNNCYCKVNTCKAKIMKKEIVFDVDAEIETTIKNLKKKITVLSTALEKEKSKVKKLKSSLNTISNFYNTHNSQLQQKAKDLIEILEDLEGYYD